MIKVPPQGIYVPPRVATLVVAASDSPNRSKAQADYVCIGVADDVWIQAALTAAAGGKVVLLMGNYVTSQNLTVPDDTVLAGCGFGTVITPTGAAIGGVQNGAIELGNRSMLRDVKVILAAGAGGGGTRPNVVMADTKTQVYVENVWIVGDTSELDDGSLYRQCGVLFDTVTHSKIMNCRIDDCRAMFLHIVYSSDSNTISGNTLTGVIANGIRLEGADYNTIANNNISGTGSSMYLKQSAYNTIRGNVGQSRDSYGLDMNDAAHNVIAGNAFYDTEYAGIHPGGAASSYNTITGNICANSDNHPGISVDSPHNVITGNLCYGNADYGIGIGPTADGCVVTGNVCYGNTLSGIRIWRSSYCVVSGNTCHDNGADGIEVLGDGTTNSDYNTVTGNACYGNTDDGIAIEGGGDANKNIVLGNQLTGNTGTALVDNGTNTQIAHNITV